jgi:DNA adenine methylase
LLDNEFEKSYESALEPIEQARRTLLRSYAGFGSVAASGRKTGFRSNITRSGTTPAIDWMRFPTCIKDFVERLQGVVIENRPADQVITQLDSPETLFYIDPPYPMSVRNVTAKWDKIYRHEMSDDDHRYLSKQLHETAGK